MRIRPITDNDIPAVAQLMRALAKEYIVNESSAPAASNFLRDNDESGLRKFVASGVVYHVAERDAQIVGFIAVRDQQHLYHMFVDKRHHRQGIARAMWAVARQAALDAGGNGVFTVNSSNYAVPAYLAMGFVRTEPTQCKNGIYYNPMQLDGRACD